MAQGSFSAQVSEWVKKTEQRMTAVRNESVQRVVEVAQTPVAKGGNMPIQTGYLRASLQGFVGNGLPALSDKPSGDGTFSFDTNQITLVIANAKLSDTITMAYGARYASHVEYGARGRPGRRFVALASQQWPRIVSEVSAEAQARNS